MGNSQILEIATANNVSLKQKTDQQQQQEKMFGIGSFFLSFFLSSFYYIQNYYFLGFFHTRSMSHVCRDLELGDAVSDKVIT